MQAGATSVIRFVAALVALLFVWPQQNAEAHAFGARYDLPLPLSLYLYAAGAAVALSFVVMAFAMRSNSIHLPVWTWTLSGRSVTIARWLAILLGTSSVAVLALITIAGFIGNVSPVKNIAPVIVWVLWWVGFVFATAFVANFWVVINPWDALARAFCAARLRLGLWPGYVPKSYPERLGSWPAAFLFIVFAWLEIISGFGELPRVLAWLIVGYSALTWAGCGAFGRNTWFLKGDVFSQVLSVYARFAPLSIERATPDKPAAITLRPPAFGLIPKQPVSWSMLVLVVAMLATVSFDGFLETPAWSACVKAIETSSWLRPALIALQGAGVNLLKLAETIALLASILLFLCTYALFLRAASAFGGGAVGFASLSRALVLSLVPIAIAYHLAHYISYLLLAGQFIIPLLSDPFGYGWDLFGTASYTLDISVIDAKAVWYVAVSAIVAGHIIAVMLSHATAMALYDDTQKALLSQLPVTVLMVLYTMVSLWILAQPVVSL